MGEKSVPGTVLASEPPVWREVGLSVGFKQWAGGRFFLGRKVARYRWVAGARRKGSAGWGPTCRWERAAS